jgi:tetratricopeptide (TPR) repeat protein
MRKHNSEALEANAVIKNVNADLKVVVQDIKDADAAHATAVQTLGASAAKADIAAKEQEIKTAKYTEVEALMTKDSAAKPDASILWAQLGQAESGLKKYDEATTAFKKALELETTAKKPKPMCRDWPTAAWARFMRAPARYQEANDAYDAAAKANPPRAAFYLQERSGHLLPDQPAGCAGGCGGQGHRGRSNLAGVVLPEGQRPGGQDHHGRQDT